MEKPSSDSSPSYSPLAAFAGLVGTIAIFLFFTGWTYRWSYFSFFQIDINSLDLPTESFLIASIQVILANPVRLGLAFAIAVSTIILIRVTLWALDPSSNLPYTEARRVSYLLGRVHRSIPLKILRYFTNLFPTDLRKDFTLTVWILIALFWFSHSQGQLDARRDFFEQTTTRPTITAVINEDKKMALAALLNTETVIEEGDAVDYPKLGGRIFGDLQQFRAVYLQGVNSHGPSSINSPVWRLLIESGHWLYVFRTNPARKDTQPPLVVALSTGDGSIESIILGPPGIQIKSRSWFSPT